MQRKNEVFKCITTAIMLSFFNTTNKKTQQQYKKKVFKNLCYSVYKSICPFEKYGETLEQKCVYCDCNAATRLLIFAYHHHHDHQSAANTHKSIFLSKKTKLICIAGCQHVYSQCNA